MLVGVLNGETVLPRHDTTTWCKPKLRQRVSLATETTAWEREGR